MGFFSDIGDFFSDIVEDVEDLWEDQPSENIESVADFVRETVDPFMPEWLKEAGGKIFPEALDPFQLFETEPVPIDEWLQNQVFDPVKDVLDPLRPEAGSKWATILGYAVGGVTGGALGATFTKGKTVDNMKETIRDIVPNEVAKNLDSILGVVGFVVGGPIGAGIGKAAGQWLGAELQDESVKGRELLSEAIKGYGYASTANFVTNLVSGIGAGGETLGTGAQAGGETAGVDPLASSMNYPGGYAPPGYTDPTIFDKSIFTSYTPDVNMPPGGGTNVPVTPENVNQPLYGEGDIWNPKLLESTDLGKWTLEQGYDLDTLGLNAENVGLGGGALSEAAAGGFWDFLTNKNFYEGVGDILFGGGDGQTGGTTGTGGQTPTMLMPSAKAPTPPDYYSQLLANVLAKRGGGIK